MKDRLKSIGTHIARYGLAIVLLGIGGMMFTVYQADGIRPLAVNSPLMSWVNRVTSVGGLWRPPLNVQSTTTRDEGTLTEVYGTVSP